jgi:hypothetical protein
MVWYLFVALTLSAWRTFMSSPAGVGTVPVCCPGSLCLEGGGEVVPVVSLLLLQLALELLLQALQI